MADAAEPDFCGTRIEDRFEVGPIFERSGMAVLHKGRDSRLQRPVAIKISRRSQRPALLAARLRNEALALARITDPRVLAPVSFGDLPGGFVYVVLEMFEGAGLHSLMREDGALSEHATACLLLELAQALEEIHAAGVVHRNLKPANVFVQRSLSGRLRVRIVDFGIAKIASTVEDGLTATGQVLGSPGFMAPEQALGSADQRSDLYSLGILGYVALLGRAPYEGSHHEVMTQQMSEPLPRLGALGRSVSEELESLLFTLTRPRPELRLASASDVCRVLEGVVGARRELTLGTSDASEALLTRMTVPGALSWSLGGTDGSGSRPRSRRRTAVRPLGLAGRTRDGRVLRRLDREPRR